MIKMMIYSDNQEITEKCIGMIEKRKESIIVHSKKTKKGLILFACTQPDIDIIVMHVNDWKDASAALRFKTFNYRNLLILIFEDENISSEILNTDFFRYMSTNEMETEFPRAVEDAISRISLQRASYLHLRQNTINLEYVMYFYSTNKVVHIRYADGPEDMLRIKLDDIQEQVERLGNMFLRINRSYYINKKYVRKDDKNEVLMSNGERISISRDYRKTYNLEVWLT